MTDAERAIVEKCAKICDDRAASHDDKNLFTVANEATKCALAIRRLLLPGFDKETT